MADLPKSLNDRSRQAKALLDAFRWHCQINPEISLPNRWAHAHQNSRSAALSRPKRR
jgi:hypothetical protein